MFLCFPEERKSHFWNDIMRIYTILISGWTRRLNGTQYYSGSSGVPGPTWEQSPIYTRLCPRKNGCWSGWPERARNVRVPMTPFLMLHTRVLLPEDEKHANTHCANPFFSSLAIARTCILSDLFTQKYNPWQLCFAVWCCVNTGCEQHVTT